MTILITLTKMLIAFILFVIAVHFYFISIYIKDKWMEWSCFLISLVAITASCLIFGILGRSFFDLCMRL